MGILNARIGGGAKNGAHASRSFGNVLIMRAQVRALLIQARVILISPGQGPRKCFRASAESENAERENHSSAADG